VTAVEASRLVQLCVVRIGGEAYAVDLKRVDEVIPVPPITPLPRAPRFLEGVVKIRGEILPVVDARKRLQVPPADPPVLTPSGKPKHTQRLMICRIGTRRIGLLVDGVMHVRRVAEAALRPAPLAATRGAMSSVLGVTGENDALILLLDVKALLTEDDP
jgi:purine-binding chemotaxis protein CheW